MCPRRFELPYAFDPLNRDGEPGADEGLSKSLETVENHVAALRLQIFLGKVVREWPDEITALSLRWSYETEGPTKAFRVIRCSFQGGVQEDHETFEEFIGFSAWTQNDLFMEKLDELFENGQRSFSREEVSGLAARTGTPQDWAAHREQGLEDKLTPTKSHQPGRPRM